jgi:hypothetical protein
MDGEVNRMVEKGHENESKLEKFLLHTVFDIKLGNAMPILGALFMLYNTGMVKPMVEAREAFAQQQAIEMMVRIYSTPGSNEMLRYTAAQAYEPCKGDTISERRITW